MTVSYSLLAGAGFQFFTDSGVPLSGGKLYTYLAGSTTPAVTYTTSAGNVQNSNPIILDSGGRVPYQIWLTYNVNYKFELTTSTGVLIKTWDDITGAVSTLNLSNSTGSSLVGFVQNGSGAVAQTAQSKMRQVVNVLDFGAVNGGSASVNNGAFANAIAYASTNGYTLKIPAGTYSLTSPISTTSSLIMEGDGDSTILDFTSASAGTMISISGSLAQIEDISSATIGNNSIVFASTPSLSTRDILCVYDPTDYSWSSARSYYRKGEWCECLGVSGNTCLTTSPLYDTYNPATVNVYKLTSAPVRVSNLKIIGGNGSTNAMVNVSFCANPIFDNVTIQSTSYSGVVFDRCYQVRTSNLNVYNKGITSDDYGLVVSNCQDVINTQLNSYARRHAIAIGGGDVTAGVPNRNIRNENSILKNDKSSGVSSADIHGNSQDVHYQDCAIYNGAAFGGMDVSYDNCYITNSSSGTVIYSSEIKGGYFELNGCNLFTNVDTSSSSRGIIDVGGNSTAVSAATDKKCTFLINDCHIKAINQSSGSDVMKYRNAGCTVPVNIKITGLSADIDNVGAVLRTRLDSGTASCDFIIIDNISGFPSGTLFHNAQGGAYTNAPHRLQSQTGRIAITATSGTSYTLSNTISFKYLYPRNPSAQVTTGTDVNILYNATRAIFSNIYKLTNVDIRVFISSGDNSNWTATVDTYSNWVVGINEV